MARKGEFNVNVEDFTNIEQRNVALLVEKIIRSKNMSQREFADTIQVSLATLTNIFRPSYNKLPTPNLIRKIAMQTADAQSTYEEIMKAGKLDLKRYPYIFGEKNTDIDIIINTEKDIIHQLAIITSNFEQRGFIEQTTINGLHFDYAIRFEDQQIKYWYFEIFAKVTSIEQLLKQFYFHIITNNGNPTHKYSLIVCDKQVYDRLSQITIPSLLTHVSIIYYENESFTETTLITACDTNNYEHELSVF